MAKKNKSIWSVQGLEKRCRELIEGGLLNEEKGVPKVCEQINSEFEEQLGDRPKLTQKALRARIPELIWTKKVKNELWRAISHGFVDKFRKVRNYIPKKYVDKEIREQKGITHFGSIAASKAGMGRLNADDLPADAGSYEFPEITYHEPYVISEDAEGQAPIINGTLIGITYVDIKSNPLRRGLADARKRKAAAVILTNIMDLWTKKTAGPLAAHRAKVSGLKINPERFPEEYRQEVQDILDGKIKDKLIYQTLDERLEEIIDALHKVTHRPKNKGPEFPGPVLVVLGMKEEELIYSASYYECRYLTIIEQNKIEAELNLASHKLAEAKDIGDKEGMEYWSSEVARLGRKKARTILTNIADSQYEYHRRRFRALIVKKLEETIPNCKVISQGSTHIKAYKHTIKIHIPHHNLVTDSLLVNLGNNYGIDVFNDTLADLTISCHPYSLNHRMVGREDSRDGQPVTKYLCVAPAALDVDFLREEFKDVTKDAHPVQKLISNPQFQSGITLLNWSNEQLDAVRIPIAKLNECEEVVNFAFPYPKLKYWNWKVKSDLHAGGADIRFIWDPVKKVHMSVDEAANEMMRRLGVVNANDIRIHSAAEMDDATDGNLWFNPTYRPDPEMMPIMQIQRALQQLNSDIRLAAKKGDKELVLKLTDDVNKFSVYQFLTRGDHFPFHQMMEVYDRYLDSQIDVWNAILERFVKSKLTIEGISKLHGSVWDTRDLGAINFPNGNHKRSTVGGADLEGDYFARHLQAKLEKLPMWRDKEEFLRKMIRAPRFGGDTFGWGTIQSPGGYRWGFRVHGSPARQSGWSDILGSVVKNDLARGDDSYGLLKQVTITLFGDKHFYAMIETLRMIYIMCAAGVRTNNYGSVGGFPPNNTGIGFVCVPVDGPDAGPIIYRKLSHDFLRDWFANPTPFAWDKFLPEPV